ncbi:MAG: hypothetical protein NVS2B17_15040 [Candidatus Velthaea sp.]
MSGTPCAIAIVGIAGRFPGAADVRQFWDNLDRGVESIRHFAADEMEDVFDAAVRARPEYVRSRAILDEVDLFDAGFFGIHRRDAELIDPQQRIFLECAWQALEDAGYDPATYPGAIGVYAGCSINSYVLRNVLGDRDAVERFTADYPVGSYPELLGAGHDFLTTRVSYKLNLRGPAMTVQSACSTSLLAVAQAAQTLMLGQADMMLAGGVSISFPQKRGYLYQSGGMVSADGHCRTFDAQSSGTVFGDGAGVVLLKRLDDAVADGDSIYAVIRGFGVNNDAADKVGYTAPSVDGQAAAVRAAHTMAGFAPETVGYIECHGTATPLGDPIEIAALARAFPAAQSAGARIALGSVKPNVGHLDVAAGITGLIKTVLAVRHGSIPPTIHFSEVNPRIDLREGPFFISGERSAWPVSGERRRAGVSAFGVGGTNVHLALESAPVHVAASAPPRPHVFILSARSEAALVRARAQLAARLAMMSDADLPDVAYTLAVGRRTFAYRDAIVASTVAEAVKKLNAPLPAARPPASEEPVIAFMFPGQGSQYAGMGSELYAQIDVFRDAIDRCSEILQPLLHADLRELLYPQAITEDAQSRLRATEIAQVAIFSVEYALARVWMQLGIEPAAMIGHSVGEFVAAVLAGVFTLEEALALVHERGRLMGSQPGGAMLAVRLAEPDLAPFVAAPVDIAAVNAPALSVVSGPSPAIDELEAQLSGRGVICRRLHTSHAFHSAMMDPVVEPLTRRAAALELQAPRIPYVSGVTGEWIGEDEATSPGYWARHCREPVRFARGLETLVAGGVGALVELGPGANLSTFAVQGVARGGAALVQRSLPTSERELPDLACLLEAAGALWVAGAPLEWKALYRGARHVRVSLPTYPFERTRYWVEPATATRTQPVKEIVDNTIKQSTNGAATNGTRSAAVTRDLTLLFEDVSGENLADIDPRATFLELGFDSLFLGRIVQHIQSRFGVAVTFRQLLDAIPSIAALSEHIVAQQPEQTEQPVTAAAPVAPTAPVAGPVAVAAPAAASGSVIEAVMRDQLAAMQQLFRDQLAALDRAGAVPAAAPAETPAETPAAALPKPDSPSRYDAFKISTSAARSDVTPAQQAHLESVIATTVARTPVSKQRAQQYRHVLADPRVAAGFRAEWKEMVYPITCVRAKGSRLWDIDGNEYIDLLNGFGQTAFGHAPDFVIDAVQRQLADGFAIGPQTDLAGQVAELFCEITGNERVTFCNTGSEAVMAAMRVARTVTGRNKIVVFEGSYHGQFDEVLVKSARSSMRSLPVAAGIPNESVSNITVLEYGSPASLTWIREHANELAAVIVEPVQSRHPGLRPKEFLTELRAVTAASGTAFVFDEVVTGFRVDPGGMQALFGIRADLATYGKVVGGGLPVGILAGSARFMDALDGGMWQYGDDSIPTVAPTFFAGTFVRHPIVMSAVLAVLQHLKAHGAELQRRLTERTAGLIARLNGALESHGIATRIESFASMFYLNLSREDRLASLLFYHLRNRGVYLQEGFPCFLTTEHTDADVEAIVAAFEDSLTALSSAGILSSSTTGAATPAAPLEIPLTEPQTEIWLAAQLGDDASCAFNESVTLRLHGALDRAALDEAWTRIVQRHESLRASFSPTGERMRIAPHISAPIAYADAAAGTRDAAEAELAARTDRDARTPFDLVSGPLVRMALLRLGADDHALIFTAHHIVCDGWSINVILDELAQLYAALQEGRTPALTEPLAFSTYASGQLQRSSAERAGVESYWLEQFREPVAPLQLPTDRMRPAMKSFKGSSRSARIERDAYRKLREAGARNGCTLFVTLLTAFQILIGRLSDSADVVVGVPTAGQSALEDEILVGHCVNFLPIRATWEPGSPVSSLLTAMKRRVLDAYEHQEYTLGTLVRKLAPQREMNRVPLAEVQFNLERVAGGMQLPGLSSTVEPNAKAFVNFDVFLNVIESEDGLRLDCDYNSDLFDAATIDRWLVFYRTLLAAITADATQTAAHINFIPEHERQALLAELNATSVDYPRDQCVNTLFEAQVARRAANFAVRFGEAALTYEELDTRANQLANYLLSRSGGTRKLVGVCVDRSIEMVVALLATLKAGCAYVPLDPSHPPARLRRILEEADVAAFIVDNASSARLAPPGAAVINLVANARLIAAMPASSAPVVVSPNDLAYVIYTSGSTGLPKGVEISHRSVVNFLSSMAKTPGFSETDSLLAVTTVSFDIAGLEIFLPLSAGGTVTIASAEEISDGFALLRKLSEVTVMQATPATWRLLLEAGFQSSARLKMLCGGEALPRELADRLLAGGGDLWNMYGPTETTIWSSCSKVTAGDEPVNAGRPIANTQMFVLDRNDQLVPAGVPGQLHIGGDGVAEGYFKRPELTSERFIRNPFGSGRIYRTGDSARMLPEGSVQILGRIDNQVKLRGYRIELGEIEAVLEKSGQLAAAAVLLREDVPGDPKLVAYYSQRADTPQSPATLRAAIASDLPKYMIPTVWVGLEALPISPSGKLDRKALPPPDELRAVEAREPASQSPTETTLLRIFAEVLHNDRIAVGDDLFELGADSLQIFAITARANAQGMRLAAKELFRYPTIAALARRLDSSAQSAGAAVSGEATAVG